MPNHAENPTPVVTGQQWRTLIEYARATRENAHAPHSNFNVGAALLTTDGRIFSGANVENGSYGLTICAERAAACSAVSAGAKGFVALVVACHDGSWPCGACRQFLHEWGGELQVMAVGDAEETGEIKTLNDLMPHAFHLEREPPAAPTRPEKP